MRSALVVGIVLASTVAAIAQNTAYEAGSAALGREEYAAAAESFERALEAEPRSQSALLKLGIARAALQEWDAAIAAYRELLEIEPRHKRALNNLANVYFRQGRYDEAVGWYERALDVDPDYLLAAFHYAWVLRQLNRPEEAEPMFVRCLELQATDDRERKTRADSLYYLGALRFRSGDHEQTARYMEQVLAVAPGHAEARYYLGMAYRHLGRMDEAREQLEVHRRLLRSARKDEPIASQP